MGTMFDVQQFRHDRLKPATGIPSHIRKGFAADNLSSIAGGDYPLADPAMIVAGCAAVRFAVEHQEKVPEPYWHGLLGVASFCRNPEETAHTWSREHPHYDPDQTERKRQGWKGTGATTCAKLGEHNLEACASCPHRGRINSPISLGYPRTAPAVEAKSTNLFDLDAAQPKFIAGGMPPREFAGPQIAPGVRLFPRAALSCLVALGAVGKTTTMLAMSAHKAAGKAWGGQPVQEAGVVMFCVEEPQEELDRKLSALIAPWPEADRNKCLKNLALVSCVGMDARLTTVDRGLYRETNVPREAIELVKAHEARCGLPVSLVCFDHLQGFTSGDLNGSETAVTLARACNRIAAETGAAVVLTAHIAKANIGATELAAGFTVGSLAIENAMRQVVGLIPMPEETAQHFGVEHDRKSYVWAGLIKNSYSDPDAGCYLRKRLVPEYHTVVIEPAHLVEPVRMAPKSANEALVERIFSYVQAHPWTTRNYMDIVAGEDGPLKAGQTKVRAAMRAMIENGTLVLHDVDEVERARNRLDKRIKQVLRVRGGD